MKHTMNLCNVYHIIIVIVKRFSNLLPKEVNYITSLRESN